MKKPLIFLLVLALLGLMAGCHKEGPAERAGKKLDDVMEQAKDKFDKATR